MKKTINETIYAKFLILERDYMELQAKCDRYEQALKYYANRMGMGGTARRALSGEDLNHEASEGE